MFTSPFESVIIENKRNRRTNIEMISISCPDAIQSEAYIATVALFIVFADSPREEKAYLRLPPIWRELWSEMVQAKKETDDAEDRKVLRRLRETISQNENAESDTMISNRPLNAFEKFQVLPDERAQDTSLTSDLWKTEWVGNFPSILLSIDRPIRGYHIRQ